MKNIAKVWRSSTAFLLSAFSFLILITSCSNELDEALQSVGNGTLQFVVSDFPMFGEGIQTRAIGTQDEGKTAWENGDQIIVTLISQKYGEQAAALTYDGSSWSTEASLSYLENETPSVSVFYAPCYEVTEEGTMQLRSGMQLGMTEYLSGNYEIENGIMTITFEDAIRDYSRLRIAGLANQTLTVTTTNFTPAGVNNSSPESGEEPQAEGSVTYTLTTDNNGNAFLYGVFAEDATVSVKQDDITLKDYTFTAEKNPNGTEHNKSYALDARPVIDGTLGGKTEATEEELAAMVELLKSYIENGLTTIIVPGTEYAMYKSNLGTIPAFAEALYLLTDLNEDSPYCGTIDLILPDATEIIDFSFDSADALKSITLPKVTTVGDGAFYGCYYLQTITFGSVVTAINHNTKAEFHWVGKKVEGCDLVLNREQVNAEADYQPNIETSTWWNTEWKSITLK